MSQRLRIMGGYSLWAAIVLLLPSCATAPGRGVSLEATRQSLQVQYPDLLQTFDLHQGIFAVSPAAWDTLSPGSRRQFLGRCTQARRAITGRSKISIQSDGEVLATYDGASAIFYGEPSIARTEDEARGADGADSLPVLVAIPRPLYPPAALRAGIEGTVLVRARLGADGSVQEIHLVDQGIELLNAAALEAARRARFRPILADASDSVWVQIPVAFSIQGVRPAVEERPANISPGPASLPGFPDGGIVQTARAGK
jgi:TonB family protein